MTLLERLQKDIKAPFGFEIESIGLDYVAPLITLRVSPAAFMAYSESITCEHCGSVKEGGCPPMPECKPAKKQIDKAKLLKLISDYADAIKKSSCLRRKKSRFDRMKASLDLNLYINSLE